MSCPFSGPGFYSPRAVVSFAVPAGRAGAGQCSPGALSAAQGLCPGNSIQDTGAESWTGKKKSGMEDPCRQPPQDELGLQHSEGRGSQSRALGRQSCCCATLGWFKLRTSAEAVTCFMFWHIKHQSWIIFHCFCGSQKMTKDFWFL